MQIPRPIMDRFNFWNALLSCGAAIFGAVSTIVFITWIGSGFVTQLENAATKGDVVEIKQSIERIKDTVSSLDERGKANNATAEANFRTINEQVNGIPYRTGQNENAIREANARIDRIVDSIGGDLKAILQGLNKTDTKVEVLGSQLDDLKKSLSRPKP